MRVPFVIVALVLGFGAVAYGFKALVAPEGGPSSAALRFDRAQIEFGSVVVGREGASTLVLSNGADEPVVVERLQTEGPFRTRGAGFELAAGGAEALKVRFVPEATGEVEGSLVARSPAFEGGEARIALRGSGDAPPEIALEPRALRFGAVSLEGRGRAVLKIVNRGGSELRVAGLATRPPFRPERSAVTIPPGSREAVEVYFAPQRPGRLEGSLRVESDDPERGTIVVPLEGEGVEGAPKPRIRVEASSVTFGKVRPGDSRRRWVTIENRGSDPLTLTSLVMFEPFRAATRGRSIAPRSSFSFPVVYAPQEEGSSFSPLVIYSNDPSSDVVTLSLFGESSADAPAAGELAAAEGRPEAVAGSAEGAPAGPEGESRAVAARGEGRGEGEEPPGLPRARPAVKEGSSVHLATHEQSLSDAHLGELQFDGASRTLRIERFRMPTVSGAFGERFSFSEVDLSGRVSELGEVDISVPVTLRDEASGSETPMSLRLTTGTAAAQLEGGTEVAVNGAPLGSDGSVTLVGIGKIPDGALEGHIWKVKLNAQVDSGASSKP